MEKLNRILAVVFLVLLGLSIFAFVESSRRGDRFERGQKFLPSLDLERIDTIAIEEGGETVTLEREGEAFTIAEREGYRAKNEAVNRFLKQLLEVELEKEVGIGEKLQEELEIEPKGESTVQVALKDSEGTEMFRFRVGKASEGGGSFLQRLDRDDEKIYLSKGSVFLTTGEDAFLKKEIVSVEQGQVSRIEGVDFVLEKEEDGGELKLADLPEGRKEKASAVSGVKSALGYLNFKEVFLADDSDVRGLAFQRGLTVELKDFTGYEVAVATKGDRYFLRIQGFHTVDRMEIGMEESEDELKEKADVLTRVDEINEFNNYHGSWVYEVSDLTAEKFCRTVSDLVEAG